MSEASADELERFAALTWAAGADYGVAKETRAAAFLGEWRSMGVIEDIVAGGESGGGGGFESRIYLQLHPGGFEPQIYLRLNPLPIFYLRRLGRWHLR
jgi:hypothetical protein